MDENLHKRCLQFIIDRDAVKAAFPMGNSAFYPVCASLFTDKGIPADTAHLKACYKLFKEKLNVFSNFRGMAEVSLVSMIACGENPEERLENAVEMYRVLKEHFWGSTYLPVAAVILASAVDREEYVAVAEKAKGIYDLMKQAHRFITSEEDSVFAAMLALSSRTPEEIVAEAEECFAVLKEHFYTRNAVQSLSHVLALVEDDMRTAKDKCRDTVALYESLKAKGYKYGTDYELATLGTLAMLPCGIEETVRDVIEVDGFLSQQKGYGFFGVGKKQRLMHAGMLVVSERSGDCQTMQSAATGSTISMVAAQHAATCAAITASVVVSNAATR